jgi:photosystem II stability/assembly factor-like uncharacterized protein
MRDLRSGRRPWYRCLVLASLLLGGAVAGVSTTNGAGSAAAAAMLPASLPNEAIWFIAVSPAYQRTGLVVAGGSDLPGCLKVEVCHHLFVSHDGGATWSRSRAKHWGDMPVYIGVDKTGHEILFSGLDIPLERSDDEGDTWTKAGDHDSNPYVPLNFTESGLVAVGGATPYLYSAVDGSSRIVEGSGGTIEDFAIMLSPTYPSGGRFAPALLNGRDAHKHEVVQQCDAALRCSGATVLPFSTLYGIPRFVPTLNYPNDGVVFFQDSTDLYKSTDGGRSFTPLHILPQLTGFEGSLVPYVSKLELTPRYKEAGPIRTMYVSVGATDTGPGFGTPAPEILTARRGVYRSDDGGATWRPLAPQPFDSVGALSMAVTPNGRVLAGGHGIWCSTDGATWRSTCPAEGGGVKAAIPGEAPTAASLSSSTPSVLWMVVGGGATLLLVGMGAVALRRRLTAQRS